MSSHHNLSYRERLLRSPQRDITPIDEPLLTFTSASASNGGEKKIARDPRDYLASYKQTYGAPFSREVAEWHHDFLFRDGDGDGGGGATKPPERLSFRTEPAIPPLRPGAPTIVVLFYPRPDEARARPVHQSASYLRRIARIARLGEQTMLYVPPALRREIEAMRPGDPHWHVVDEWASIWDVPSNAHQRRNFEVAQPALFAAFDGYGDGGADAGDLRPEPRYNRAHHSAVCNAKAFVVYDAVLRNPFGSARWMYADAGFLFDDGPRGSGSRAGGEEEEEPWGELFASGGLDETKFDRAIAGASGASGVVMGEYSHAHAGGCPTVDADGGGGDGECGWMTDPRRTWRARQFIAQVYVGSSLGMLHYSAKFMRTVEDMGACGFYVGREELVVAFVALRYPHTVFSVPFFRLPARTGLDYAWQFPMKLAFSRVGGPESMPPIVDPLATLYCRGYVPRRPALPAGGIYEGCEIEGPPRG